MKKTKLGAVALGMGAVMILGSAVLDPSEAEAASFTWYNGRPTAGVWKGISSGANYSKARATTHPNAVTHAYLSVTGVGTASGSASITTSFSPRRVNAKCKWDWYLHNSTAPLTCVLS